MPPSPAFEPDASAPDHDLAEAVLGHDVVAIFENVYAAYAGDAHRVAMAVLHDPEPAADAVHAAFVELLRHVLAGRRWHDPAEARRAVQRNARWAALKMLRARRTRPEVALDGIAAPVHDDAGWARAEARAVCREIVARLRPAQREALHLHFVQGLTATQAAARLGITTGAFEARVHRAVRSARRAAKSLGVLGLAGLSIRVAAGRLRGIPRIAAQRLRAPAASLSSGVSLTALVMSAGAVAAPAAHASPPPHTVPATATQKATVDTPLTATIIDTLRLAGGTLLLLGEGRQCACGLVFASHDGGRTWRSIPVPIGVAPGDRLAVSGARPPVVFIAGRDGSTFTSAALTGLGDG